MSNIVVSVQWEKSMVFAGEEVACTIIFKNVAPTYGHSRSPSPNTHARRNGQGRDHWKLEVPGRGTMDGLRNSKTISTGSTRPQGHGHRSTLSLNTQVAAPPKKSVPMHGKAPNRTDAPNNRHKRSVSILSIGRDTAIGDMNKRSNGHSPSTQPPIRPHSRSASLQSVPWRAQVRQNGPSESTTLTYNSHKPTDYYAHSDPAADHKRSLSRSPVDPNHAFQTRNDLVLRNRLVGNHSPLQNHSRSPSFKFPRATPTMQTPTEFNNSSGFGDPLSSIIQEDLAAENHPRVDSRVLSPISMAGTPRSSLELYNLSNNSTETLASEYVSPALGRQKLGSGHTRQPSHLAPIISQTRPPETLMMGYVQLMGSFTIDGSLVNQAPFESIKRRGVIGGQGGGGVVGVDSPKKESGLFGALGWNTIGESLGGLLGVSELSSIREMKGIANTNSIPIISTPQAILFVDLKLAPGESKCFWYSHPLPKGIPPTHKGRAMKTAYQLVIGTQRAQSAAQQHVVKHVDIPFKVLPGVNAAGEILGHDLWLPHIILKNIARSEPLDDTNRFSKVSTKVELSKSADLSLEGVLSYVETLLSKPRQNSTLGLLSPTEVPMPNSKQLSSNENASMKETIDFAILRGNALTASKRSANKFQIKRGGEQVAVIILARPAYRLGETVSAVVDFREASLDCYYVNFSLETSEVVDPSIALRSSSSIHRATRRVHATSSENTLFTQRAVFNAVIPISFAPEFITSGVELQWQLRFEFLTGATLEDGTMSDELLAEATSDDRGRVLVATQRLSCEIFDVSVPVRVYGAVTACKDHSTNEYPI